MTNGTAYVAGYRAELEARRILEKEGCLVIRSASSKGPFDLVAFGKMDCRAIQIKRRAKGGALPAKADLDSLRKVSLPSFVTKEIWVREKGGGWSKTEVR